MAWFRASRQTDDEYTRMLKVLMMTLEKIMSDIEELKASIERLVKVLES